MEQLRPYDGIGIKKLLGEKQSHSHRSQPSNYRYNVGNSLKGRTNAATVPPEFLRAALRTQLGVAV